MLALINMRGMRAPYQSMVVSKVDEDCGISRSRSISSHDILSVTVAAPLKQAASRLPPRHHTGSKTAQAISIADIYTTALNTNHPP